MPISIDNIGKYNKQLVLDLIAGNDTSSGAAISEWRHAQSYNYDLSYGIAGINSKRSLPGKKVGVKYYCADSSFNWDMAKRIVHIYDPTDSSVPAEFYRLIHTPGDPGLRDNSYSQCERIVV